MFVLLEERDYAVVRGAGEGCDERRGRLKWRRAKRDTDVVAPAQAVRGAQSETRSGILPLLATN